MNRDNCCDTDMEFVTSGTKVKCVKYFWAEVKFSRFFSGEIDIFWNFTGVKYLTNSKSVVTFHHARVTVSPIGKSSTSRKSFSLSSYLERRVGGGGPSLQFPEKYPKYQKQAAGQGPLQMRARGEPHPSK